MKKPVKNPELCLNIPCHYTDKVESIGCQRRCPPCEQIIEIEGIIAHHLSLIHLATEFLKETKELTRESNYLKKTESENDTYFPDPDSISDTNQAIESIKRNLRTLYYVSDSEERRLDRIRTLIVDKSGMGRPTGEGVQQRENEGKIVHARLGVEGKVIETSEIEGQI